MIKTVSFAPPRQAGSRSSAKPAGAKVVPVETLRPVSPRAASGRNSSKAPKIIAQTSLSFEFGAPDEAETEVVAAPGMASKTVEREVGVSEVGAPIPVAKSGDAPVFASKTAKKSATPASVSKGSKQVAGAAIEAPLTPVATTSETKAPAAKAEAKIAVETQAFSSSSAAKSGEVKAKRARVPKDLAEQYGEKTVVRTVAPPVEAEIVKKRLNKVERQARRELIKPSEDLMARLALANQIAARKPKAEPRGKGWKFQCGRCGTISYFETPGGLCACGTIAVKE